MVSSVHVQSPNSVLSDIADAGGPLDQVMHVLELVIVSGAGLGEVLPDYAGQTLEQLEELKRACTEFSKGQGNYETIAILKTAYFTLSSTATVLEMIPAAMIRNKADMIGNREKMSREEVVRITRAFRHSPQFQPLMASEASGAQLLQQVINLQGGTSAH